MSPAKLKTAVREMAMSAIALPDLANRMMERANRGEIQLQIPSLPESALLLYAALHQVLFAFLATARQRSHTPSTVAENRGLRPPRG